MPKACTCMNSSQVIVLLRNTASTNDGQAFRLFFNYYYERMVQFAQLFVSSRCQAEDAVSEVFIRMFRMRGHLFFMENFEAYLFRSVRNQVFNELKSEKYVSAHRQEMRLTEKLHDRVDPHETLMASELLGQINKIIGRLPRKRQQVYRLIKDQGMRHKEVARMMEISERTVEVHLKIAVRELRCALTTYLEETNPVAVKRAL
jgi:RNA polymerase sigma-70 factor (family 1)